jgi:hypothetical protein
VKNPAPSQITTYRPADLFGAAGNGSKGEAAIATGMTAIGFCGGSHCGPEHGDRLLARGAALIIADMRELWTAMAKLVR